jgi:hypothetical protein
MDFECDQERMKVNTLIVIHFKPKFGTINSIYVMKKLGTSNILRALVEKQPITEDKKAGISEIELCGSIRTSCPVTQVRK